MPGYLLARHAHLCLTDDYAVVLDLKSDRYLALSGPQLHALSERVSGWPECRPRTARATAGAHEDEDRGSDAVFDRLVERGILTTDRRQGKVATPVSLCAAAATLVDDPLMHTLLADQVCDRAGTRVCDVACFAASYALAATLLRGRPIERVVDRVRTRKQERVDSSSTPDLAAARDRVRIFRQLRPFFLTARQRCLLHSLTLIEFLASYGLFPAWVFGVKSGPFAAHCWVQEQSIVFNDTPEHVGRYTPIMAV